MIVTAISPGKEVCASVVFEALLLRLSLSSIVDFTPDII